MKESDTHKFKYLSWIISKILKNLIIVSSALDSQVKPCLDKLNNDNDMDVRYFASEALGGKFPFLISFKFI